MDLSSDRYRLAYGRRKTKAANLLWVAIVDGNLCPPGAKVIPRTAILRIGAPEEAGRLATICRDLNHDHRTWLDDLESGKDGPETRGPGDPIPTP